MQDIFKLLEEEITSSSNLITLCSERNQLTEYIKQAKDKIRYIEASIADDVAFILLDLNKPE